LSKWKLSNSIGRELPVHCLSSSGALVDEKWDVPGAVEFDFHYLAQIQDRSPKITLALFPAPIKTQSFDSAGFLGGAKRMQSGRM
jgi:hypothetical protein